MKRKPTLYELFGLSTFATAEQVQAAYEREMQALEAQRAALTPEAFKERDQLLRLAGSTLRNPGLRASYDAELEAAERAARAAAATSALVSREQVRADALGLRADALSLRADAMLARAELEATTGRKPPAAAAMLAGANHFVRAIGLLVLIGAGAFGFARCALNEPAERRALMETRAAEQVALQEYFLTHGVRPSSMADLERMEADRQRRANEARQAEQERRRLEEEQRSWEDDARRTGERVGMDLQVAEADATRRAERLRALKAREEQLQLQLHFASSEADRRRLEQQLKQLREPQGPQ